MKNEKDDVKSPEVIPNFQLLTMGTYHRDVYCKVLKLSQNAPLRELGKPPDQLLTREKVNEQISGAMSIIRTKSSRN